ncbi:MAG: hypothetical protein WCO56_17790 [Verrucomicrobiota bacterium]
MSNPWPPRYNSVAVCYNTGWSYPLAGAMSVKQKQPNKGNKMKKQPYYPSRISDQTVWLDNFIRKAPGYVTPLGLVQAEVDAVVAGCKFLHYVLDAWVNSARVFSMAVTKAEEAAAHGLGTDPIVLPVFTAPALPTGVAPVAPGTLTRVYELVRVIKGKSAYTDTIGQDLLILAREDAALYLAPSMTVKIVSGETQQNISIRFVKYGHEAVLLESRRNGGAWERLDTTTHSPYVDARPLLVANTAETREYRARFSDKNVPNGDWSTIIRIAVTS